MDTAPYIAKQAKPKVNVAPVFESLAHGSESEQESALPAPETSKADRSTPPVPNSYATGWDMRFAVGLILSIILVNTALVLLLTEEDAHHEAAFQPVEEVETGEEYTQTPSVTRPVRTARDLEGYGETGASTGVYVTPEQRQLLLRQLNSVATQPAEEQEVE